MTFRTAQTQTHTSFAIHSHYRTTTEVANVGLKLSDGFPLCSLLA